MSELSRKEQSILDSIVVASENDPKKPEFPSDGPKFPATPTYRINVPGFNNVWIKDESVNPTGTHKDRLAWEIIVTYRDFLKSKSRGQIHGKIPSMSIISSGSAATAIQVQLKKYKLPNLKVLVNKNINSVIVGRLKKLGCELYFTDLKRKVLKWEEILKLTNNEGGFDITSNHAFDPTTRFYDWLSYEIINTSPDFCFIPFGTGNLYENVLNINKKEVNSKKHDPRFKGTISILRNCHFIGATVNKPSSIADKLYSPHLPFSNFDKQWIRFYKYAGYCGKYSGVGIVKEVYLHKAMILAHDQGINCEPSGIAGLAMLLQSKNKVASHCKILIVNTGNSSKLDNLI